MNDRLNPQLTRSQFAPGWSGVNIALMVVLFIVAWPLGLLMLGYILAGDSLGLNLGQPQPFIAPVRRVGAAINAGIAEFHRLGELDQAQQEPRSAPTGFGSDATVPSQRTTSANTGADDEIASLNAQREALQKKIAELERKSRDNAEN